MCKLMMNEGLACSTDFRVCLALGLTRLSRVGLLNSKRCDWRNWKGAWSRGARRTDGSCCANRLAGSEDQWQSWGLLEYVTLITARVSRRLTRRCRIEICLAVLVFVAVVKFSGGDEQSVRVWWVWEESR
jgi:hypothetical protein